jgi:hypothetical protein
MPESTARQVNLELWLTKAAEFLAKRTKTEGEAVTAYFLIDDDGDVLEVYSKREDARQALVGEYFLHIEERCVSADTYHCLLTSERATEEHRLSLEQGHRRRELASQPR